MAHPLGEYGLQAVVVGAAIHQIEADHAPSREGPVDESSVRIPRVEIQRQTRRRIEQDVYVVLDTMLVARAREHVVGLERHVVPELPCHADGALPAVPDFRQLPRGRS